MTITLIILAIAIVLFITGKIRSDIVALGALTLLLLFGILTPAEALAGFSSTVVVMMVGLFVVGGAIMQTGLAKAAGKAIVRFAGGSETRIFLLVVIVTAVLGALINNTGTVAIMMPIVVSLAAGAGISHSRLLMPIAFASSMGGALTLIGTPPNLLVSETLEENGFAPLAFFDFTPVGLLCLATGIVVLIPLTRLFLRGKTGAETVSVGNKTLDSLVEEYHLDAGLRRYRIKKSSKLRGKTVAEANLRRKYGISILEIRNESQDRSGIIRNVRQSMPSPDHVLEENDILCLSGDPDTIKTYAKQHGMERIESEGMEFYDIGIAEIVLMPAAKLIGTKLKYSGFRETYDINVLGIRRGQEYIQEGLPDVVLTAGDVLLVQGHWDNIAALGNRETDWVVLGQPEKQAAKVALTYRAPLAAVIMIAMVAVMVFDFIPVAPVTAVMAAALLMVLTGCFRSVEAAYKTINWESIFLIAAMMPMSSALEKTGISAAVAGSLVDVLGAIGPSALLAGIYFTTTILSLFISNTATAVLMAPIAMTAALSMSLSPYPFLFAVAYGAGLCFATPFATPPNALVMHAGEYSFADYVKVGLPLQLIVGIVVTAVLPLAFPF